MNIVESRDRDSCDSSYGRDSSERRNSESMAIEREVTVETQ